jgi:hypothetical protein
MDKLTRLAAAGFVLLCGLFAINHSAFAQPVVPQNRVVTGADFEIVSANGAFEEQFQHDDADFTDCAPISGGTTCIDSGRYIVNPETWNPGNVTTALYDGTDAGCQPPKRSQTTGNCSALDVAEDGTTYIAGIRNKNGSAVFEVIDLDGPCNGIFSDVGTTGLCSRLLVEDRPPIIDVDVTELGLLILENRDTINLLTGFESGGDTTVDTIADARNLGLTLKGKDKEQLLNVSLIEYADNGNPPRTAFAVTTSHDRLIAFESVDGIVTVRATANLVESATGLVPLLEDVAGCVNPEPASYDVTQDIDALGPLHVTASNTCYVHTINLVVDVDGDITGFSYDDSDATRDGLDSDGIDNDVDGLIDEPDEGTTYIPLLVGVSTGTIISYTNPACAEPLDEGGCGAGSATIGNFQTVPTSAETGTMWEIGGLPHCVLNPRACGRVIEGIRSDTDANARADLCEAGVIMHIDPLKDTVDDCIAADAELLAFDATPTLPLAVSSQFDILPALVLPPAYRAQSIGGQNDGIDNDGDGETDNGDPEEMYYYSALMFKNDGVQAAGSPEFQVTIEAIAGNSLGCPEGTTVDSLVSSDIIVRVPDAFPGADGEFQGSMSASACFNPQRSAKCCSFFPLNWSINPWPATLNDGGVDPDGNPLPDVWATDEPTPLCELGHPNCTSDDTTFAKLYDMLSEEMLANQQQLLCTNTDVVHLCGDGVDDNGDGFTDDPGECLQPVPAQLCTQLENNWFNGHGHWIHAISNTLDGTNCSGDSRAYQAVDTKRNQYRALLETFEGNFATCTDGIDNDLDGFTDDDPDETDCAGDLGLDPANRLGLQIGMTNILDYVFDQLLKPAIPEACPDGWQEEDTTWIFNVPPATP